MAMKSEIGPRLREMAARSLNACAETWPSTLESMLEAGTSFQDSDDGML